ncbi:MAG: PhoH family protein [Thermoleophilia bacterium]|nr:PhoH family protein [Thermoleophilia bacterium]
MGTRSIKTIELDRDVAEELAGEHDRNLRSLEERLDLTIDLRGNRVTLEGDAGRVDAAESVIDRLASLAESGQRLEATTIDAVARAVEVGADSDPLEDVVWRNGQLVVAPRTSGQAQYVRAIRESTITFGVGPAGTGKTYLAVAMASAALARRDVSRVILSRPAVEAGENLGFLPGDLSEKVDPYVRPLFDALYDMLDPDRVATMIERGQIEIAPLAFMRGRTLNDSFVILDEAQNATAQQMKMFLTRLGHGSRMVVTGDDTQIDLPKERRSGLLVANEVLAGVDDMTFVRLGRGDVVRHRLVQSIIDAYEKAESRE